MVIMALIVNFGITSSKTHSLCTILIVEGKLERERERGRVRGQAYHTLLNEFAFNLVVFYRDLTWFRL